MRKKYNSEYFSFLKEGESSQRNKLRLKEILKIKKSGKYLEIGPGLGGLANLARKYFNIETIEISDYASNILKKEKIKVIGSDLDKTPLKKEAYDVIVLFNVLEHLRNPFKSMKKIRASLKKGGIIIGSVPNNQFGMGWLFTKYSNLTDRTHISTLKFKRWKKIFEGVGLKSKFFGEIMLTQNKSFYIKRRFWKKISPNLVFICEKN